MRGLVLAAPAVAIALGGCGGGAARACFADVGAQRVDSADDLSFARDNLRRGENVRADVYGIEGDESVLVVSTQQPGETFAFEQFDARDGADVTPERVVRNPSEDGKLGRVYVVTRGRKALADCLKDAQTP